MRIVSEPGERSTVGRRLGMRDEEFADQLHDRDWTPPQVEGRLSILLDLVERWKEQAETAEGSTRALHIAHARELQAAMRRMLFGYPPAHPEKERDG
jgi:hypothetical protein